MSTGGAGPLVPTFHGFVHNSMDGLVLFEACLSGKLHHVPRRPHDRERSSLIKSGSIFIYEENASGIKRWTDGVAWSPSRILGNFLIYRELEKPFPPGEKKRAMKRKRTSIPGEPYPRRDSDENEAQEVPTPLTPPTPNAGGEVKPEVPGTDQDKELERSLIGSLVDSYGFRPEGLVKKTMSISVNGISHHMVSYYKVDDVKNNLLPRPLSDPRLQNISVRPELYLKQNFRAPVEETEHYAIDGHMNAHPQMMYSSMAGSYPAPQGQYFQQQGRPYPGMYNMPPSSAGMPYGSMAGQSWPAQQAPPAPMPYGGHQQHHQQQHPQHQQQQHQPYGGQGYGSYYKPEQQANGSASKAESQQPASQYGNTQYASAYPAMQQRSGSQSTPSMMQAPYHTPAQPQQPGSSAYGRPSYDSPTTGPQSHSAYGASQSQYAVRSPTSQSYGAPPHTQSPHPAVKSPQPTHQGTPAQSSEQQHNAYRSSSNYAHGPPTPQSAHPSHGEMNGLGISSNSSSYPPPPPQNGHGHHAYGSTSQAQTAGPYPS